MLLKKSGKDMKLRGKKEHDLPSPCIHNELPGCEVKVEVREQFMDLDRGLSHLRSDFFA